MALVGYARVSSVGQSLDVQRDKLKDCAKLFEEKQSGSNSKRPQLAGVRYEDARRVFNAADKGLGFSIKRLCFEGPDEQHKLTENTQPAILTMSSVTFPTSRDSCF